MVRLLANGNGNLQNARLEAVVRNDPPAEPGAPAAGAGFLPDLDFQFQIDSELLGNFRACQVDELQDVFRGRARMSDDEIGMAVAEFSLAVLRSLKSCLIDEPAGAHPAGILEDAAGRLEGQRLRRLF